MHRLYTCTILFYIGDMSVQGLSGLFVEARHDGTCRFYLFLYVCVCVVFMCVCRFLCMGVEGVHMCAWWKLTLGDTLI